MIRRHTSSAVRLAVGLTYALVLVWAAWSHAGTIVIDVAVEEGPITHRANGYLVSIEPNDPPTSAIAPLRPTSFRGNAGYVFSNYDRLTRLGVTEFQLTLGLVFHHLDRKSVV